MNHRIIDNVLRDNKSFGLGVDTINNVPGQETIIAGNTITGNKIHGIEIMGNHYIIEGNKVSGNGWGAQGSSGIHLFAKNAKADTCKHNIIRYNISYANRDDGGEDGNGIQLDQWCDDNQVYFNVTFANEGAGINLFDAAHNVVVNNTVFDNMRGPKGHSYRTELLVASDGKNTDRASDNVIRNNIIAATRPDNVAIYVDGLSAAHPQEIGNNILFHAAPAGQVFFWNGRAGREIAVWNGLKRGAADIAADPQFTDPGQPLAGGLSVRPTSPALGHGVAIAVATTRDVLGNPLRLPPIGAYAAPR
jgi:parallel beta-helix repeat protein